MKKIKLYKEILLMGALIILSLVGLWFGVIPLGERTVKLWKEMSVLNRDINTLTDKSSILESLDENTLRNKLQVLTTAIPTEKSIETIFATLDNVSGSDVAVMSFQLSKSGSIATGSAKKLSAEETKLGSNILPFSITVSGSYDGIRNFATSITSVRRLFDLRGMEIAFTASGVSARLDLNAFYFPYPKVVGAVASPIVTLSEQQETVITYASELPLMSSVLYPVGTPSADTSGGKVDPFSP